LERKEEHALAAKVGKRDVLCRHRPLHGSRSLVAWFEHLDTPRCLDCGGLVAVFTVWATLQSLLRKQLAQNIIYRLRIGLTARGFITWPTKNLKTPSFPPLYFATLSGFLAITSRAASSIAECR